MQHFTKEQVDAFREAKLEEKREQMRQERAKFKQYMEMDQEREVWKGSTCAQRSQRSVDRKRLMRRLLLYSFKFLVSDSHRCRKQFCGAVTVVVDQAEKKLEEKPSEIGFWRDFQMSFAENVLSDKMKAVMILYGLDTRKSVHHPKHPQISPTADLVSPHSLRR